jgi:hypothetical protein
MPSPTSYPPISALIPHGWIGSGGTNGIAFLDQFGAAIDNIEDKLLGKLRYRDLTIETSASHDIGQYRLTLVTEEAIQLTLPAGLTLILFPDTEPTNNSSVSVSYFYEWPVKAYVHDFEMGKNPAEMAFALFLRLADISEEQFYQRILDIVAPSNGDYAWLIGKIKSWDQDFLLTGADLVDGTEIEQILQSLRDIDADAYVAAFEAIFQDAANFDLEQTTTQLIDFFRDLVGDIDRDDFEKLLLPHFAITIESFSIGIAFPPAVLRPLDGSDVSKLTFTAGALTYDTRTGFDIAIDESIGIDFTPSEIGKTGLTLAIEECKLDLSPNYNIPEAIADMRPQDFMGVFCKSVEIGLPRKWFSSASGSTTLAIVGRNLLIGTGGFSGTIGLEALDAITSKPSEHPKLTPPNAEIEFILGKQPPPGSSDPPKGFKIGFSKFDMKFRQNVLLESTIKGSLTIPKFDSTKPIGIELFIAKDGDFKVTASVAGGHLFEVGTIFAFNAMSMSIEKDDNRVYAEATGDLSFPKNSLLKNFIKEPIHIEKLRIGSDGSFEIDGGTIPLPESVVIPLGPAKIAITAIHCGSHEQEHGSVTRKYRYWGFDGGINVNPGGIDARGDGIKYYYTVDNGSDVDHQPHHFLRIEGIGIDLVIPGTASKEQAVLLLKGYLALKNPVYKGSLSFVLPKVKIAGGASMIYNTEVPAWLVDVWLELPKPIPLGATSLGIYGFRGLFGLRYVAAKEAVVPALPADASWGDYYRAPPKGVSYDKFVSPPATNAAGNPFSVGAGVSLATAQDGGKAFTSQLFLLVSIPNLILLEGRADILAKKRVGLTDEDPPYYAYLALSPESIEIGAGVSYKIPKETGEILNLTAVFEAAFFFRNRNAWYIHFGTKKKPITARILNLFDGYSYLMLSASGIEAGAGVHFDFAKSYGPVAVSAHAYLDMWAYISFQGTQSGGGIALGGYVDVRVMGIGFHIELAAGLSVEAPKPFRVAGYVEVCVSVDLKIKKFEKCVNLEFVWERDNSINDAPVWALTDSPMAPPATGVHMASGSTYAVEFSTNPHSAAPPTIPLDTYIDVKFAKPVNPAKGATASARIGGFTNPPSDNFEKLPPQYGSRIVSHSYALEDVKLEVWSATTSSWIDYDPFVALAPQALVSAAAGTGLAGLPVGFWQKQETGYSQIRFLGLTPFNYMEPIGDYRPEEMGLTAQTIFCQGQVRTERCLLWDEPATYSAETNYYRAGILYRIEGSDGATLQLTLPSLAPVSLGLKPGARAVFEFSKKTVFCRLMLFTNAPQITLRFQRRKASLSFTNPGHPGENIVPYSAAEFEDVAPPIAIPRSALFAPVIYNNSAAEIDRIVLETPAPNVQLIADLEEKIALRQDDWTRADVRQRVLIEENMAKLQQALEAERNRTCVVREKSTPEQLLLEISNLSEELAGLRAEIRCKSWMFDTYCKVPPPPPAPSVPPPRDMSEDACRKLADQIAALKKRVKEIESRLPELEKRLATAQSEPRFPAGWQCGTFVHELCWLSEEDSQYNQTIPSIAAIEADFDAMRTAIKSTIAPIWRPNAQYRITLKVSDTITASSNPPVAMQSFYIHFQTKGPLGHYEVPPERPQLANATPVPAPGEPLAPDDDRPEVAERFLKFYIDMERSYPDPSGNLLYAKPLYYSDVVLQLFMAKPHAYHFFADWPPYPPVNPVLGAAPYAIDIRIKDPAETEPSTDPSDHAAAIIAASLAGTQTWEADASPRMTEDLKVLNNFHDPELLDGSEHGTACLTTGGTPIVPAAKVLVTEIKDLLPNKLYTAVVLNKDVLKTKEAEVHRYPFKTSRYGDFASHISSYKLEDDAGNARHAVFKISHALANAAGAPQIYATALSIIKREPSADTKAYPDFFDRLVHACLKLETIPPAATVEFSFIENNLTGEVYGLWIRSPEALNDPRIPSADLLSAIKMQVNGIAENNARVLLSRDCCHAFVMIEGGAFPLADVSFQFSLLTWDNDNRKYVAKEAVATESFSSP